MTISEILRSIESHISTKQEREYFLIHVERYRVILEEIIAIVSAQKGAHGSQQNFVRLPSERKESISTKSFFARGSEDESKFSLATDSRPEKLKVLDVGCFPYHLGAAMEMMNMDVYGIASEHEPLKNKKIAIINIEKDKFPYKDNFFDIIVFTEVLEHLPQSPLHALKEMHRILAPRGNLLLTTPNIARSINRAKMLLGKSVSYPLFQVLENDGAGSNIYHRHNREYTLSELTTLTSQAGFVVSKATHFISYTPTRRRAIPDKLLIKAGKFANYALMLAVASMRDTLLVVGMKK